MINDTFHQNWKLKPVLTTRKTRGADMRLTVFQKYIFDQQVPE